MKKRIKNIIIIIFIILILLCIIVCLIKKKENNNIQNDYLPEEEISLEQERETMISLYYKNKVTGEIEPEVRLVDVKEIVKDPYNVILNLLMENPKNDNLEKTIGEGTKINNISLEGDTLTIDFSKEFINNQEEGKENEINTIESILKTMTELSEVNSIKINIDGETESSFIDNEVSFANKFTKDE